MKKVTITTDGACDPNPGPGGWAAILRFENKLREISGSSPRTTNNRMEIHAIVEGLRVLKQPCEVLVRTDSKIAISWCKGAQFAKERHRLAHPEAYASHLAFQELAKIHRVSFQWVQGHAGDPDNERADFLAASACQQAGGLAPVVAAPAATPFIAARPVPAAPAAGKIRLTRENLHALSGSPGANGFTRKQVELLGFSYPPPKGWLSGLIGRDIEQGLYDEVRKAIAAKWKQRKEQGEMAL
ncbi:MAG TPA: RNase H family protein [Lacunisphaera sp.]|jgi:ribonuclease HI|nr:RNase H family protein [Lacunisphaera sp.]